MGNDNNPSEVQFGRYRLIARLATGGMAEVFLATQSGPGGFEKLVAIKWVKPGLDRDERFVTMLFDEARLAARLNHANVVQVLDLGFQEGRYFIAMEFLFGENLGVTNRTVLTKGERFSPGLVAGILAKVAEGLHHAHTLQGPDSKSLQLIHRDVCPQNILVQYDGVVKVVDFGIAWAESRLTETRTGVLKGKLAYMSPEQIRGGTLDARSDVFSLGVVLWECLAGRRLFLRDTDLEILEAITGEDAPSLDTIDPEIPGQLVRIAARALTRDRDLRYPSAAEMQQALAGYVQSTRASAGMVEIGKFMQDLFPERMASKQRAIRGATASGDTIEDFTRLFSDIVDVGTRVKSPAERPVPRERSWWRQVRIVVIGGALLAAGVLGSWLLLGETQDPPRKVDPGVMPDPDRERTDPGPSMIVEPLPKDTRPRPLRRKKRKVRGKKKAAEKVTNAVQPADRPGRLRLNTTPWVEIYHQGRKIGQTPLVDVELPAGHIELRAVNREDGIDRIIHVIIKPGQTIVRHHSFL